MDKPKLTIINGTPASDSLKERARDTLRKTKQKGIPQCPHCGSRTYIVTQTGTLKQKVCAFCFMGEKRMVIMA